MADTNADAPKRNAVAGEAPKSLSTTIQNVIAKAVTSPNDPKIDFAQGVNHITGDAHQKSAGKADAMQSLKASTEPEKKPEAVKENEDAPKKDDKEVVKANAEKEVKKESEDEKKKEIKANAEKDAEKKLQAQTDAEKKADVKEQDDEKAKELKAQEIKDKMKQVDVKEDVKALVGNESDLSDEFKTKASTIFEAAVRNKLADEVIRLEDEYAEKVKTETETAKNEIVEKVDGYLNYIVEEWMKENELAVEKGLKGEIAEDFISGLKKLFESHYIDIPEEKYNVIEDQAAKIEELNKKLNESIEKNVELNKDNAKHTRDEILADVASDLADSQKDKFNGLAENVEYNDAADFRKKVETLKASYFPRDKATSDEINDVAGTQGNVDSDMTESMAAYTAAITKQKKLDIYNKK